MATHTDTEGKRKKRRVRSPHPGVVVLERERATGTVYLARWTDPDTGRRVELSLSTPDLRLTNAELRKDWAVKKSKSLAERRAALASGTAVISCTSPATAIETFYQTQQAELKDSTLTVYREATDPFAQWAQKAALACIEDLTPPKLTAFRDWFVARPAYAQAKGGKRGSRKLGKRKRSAGQINKCIRSLRTVLNHWRKRGLTPALTSDAIRDHLPFVKGEMKLIRFLKPAEIRALLEACQRHDAESNDGRGHTHPPIGPFVLTVLLTGMRFSEAAALRWKDVDLEADEITLQHDATKTGQGRRIGLAETPALAALLKSFKLRAGKREFLFAEGAPLSRDVAEAARRRLVRDFGAPAEWSWHDLRRTCGTYLTCAPAIYGAASAFLSAKRLGHGVAVAEKHYLGAITNIPADARTLEAAMHIEKLCVSLTGSIPAGLASTA
ncbi:MAG: tyrosine-type recombinase/integrase [Planctomycetes bacterium]|nr:tyrosine-type recombinase/integrase [Planctomycetota bacterium]